MSQNVKHCLAAEEIALLWELLNIYAEILTTEDVIHSYENPTFSIQLVPLHVYNQQIAVRENARRKLQIRLDTLGEDDLHIAIAFEEAKQYVKPNE